MNIIVCLDNNGGTVFNNRRQSRDRVLIDRIIALSTGRLLRMSRYSGRMFKKDERIITSDNFMLEALPGDYCFIENTDILPFTKDIESVIVFRWNRCYPFDAVFPLKEIIADLHLINCEDFQGFSHDKITMEVFK